MEFQQALDYEFINGRKVLKKHVATIHCSNKLSLLERKISNALLFHAFAKLKDQLIHEITIEQLKRLLGANTRNHKALKEALKTLISTVIEWNLLGDNVPEMELEGWNASTILSSVSVKKGVIKYQYSELIKSLIMDPSIYGKINLVIQSRFKSSYALALYENCARYRGLDYTKNFDIAIFRKLMGVEDGKYEIFRDFNRRVLNPAVTEINTCSDIRVIPEIMRRGRKVQSIKFKIEERPIKQRIGIQATQEPVMPAETLIENTMINELRVQPKELAIFYENYGKDRVNKAIDYVKSRPAFKNGTIRNVPGYLKAAIENAYKTTASDKIETVENESAETNLDAQWRLLKHDYFRYLTADMIHLFSKLPETEQHQLVEALLTSGEKILGPNKELLITVYFDALGTGKNRVQKAISENNCHLNAFFESGFSEFLLKTDAYFSSHVISFVEYLEVSNNIEQKS